MMELKLSYFENIMRKQGSLEKTVILGEIKDKRQRLASERSHRQESAGAGRAVEDRTLWMSLIQRVTQSQSM